MEYKLLEENDLNLMQEVLYDDNMIFNLEYLNDFINNKNAFGFVSKEKIKL